MNPQPPCHLGDFDAKAVRQRRLARCSSPPRRLRIRDRTIELAIRKGGSSWAWALTGGAEVGSGDRTDYRHGVTQQATEKRIRADEFLIRDLHPRIDLFLADSSIPVFIRKPIREQQQLIDCWEETAEGAVRTGRSGGHCAAGDGWLSCEGCFQRSSLVSWSVS